MPIIISVTVTEIYDCGTPTLFYIDPVNPDIIIINVGQAPGKRGS